MPCRKDSLDASPDEAVISKSGQLLSAFFVPSPPTTKAYSPESLNFTLRLDYALKKVLQSREGTAGTLALPASHYQPVHPATLPRSLGLQLDNTQARVGGLPAQLQKRKLTIESPRKLILEFRMPNIPTLDAVNANCSLDSAMSGNHSEVLQEPTLEEGFEPAMKRHKTIVMRTRTGSRGSLTIKNSLSYAQEPATLRKAMSLRSETSVDNLDELPDSRLIWFNTLGSGIAYSPADDDSLIQTQPNSPTPESRTPIHRVPIIAPPLFHRNRTPAYPKEAAGDRLRILLSKERQQRMEDGLPSASLNFHCYCGIEIDFRTEVIDWILTLKPRNPENPDDLYNQLCTSPETRFMAAYLFRRFFYMSGVEEEPDSQAGGCRYYIWDIAVACIALGVKMLRDFLFPLNPVNVGDFIALAAHEMSYEDFQTAQKDVLETFSYQLNGNSPQPFIDEVGRIIPTLKNILSFDDDCMIAIIWARFFDMLMEPYILCAPISVLLACVLEEIAVEKPCLNHLDSILLVAIHKHLNVIPAEMHSGMEWLATVERVFSPALRVNTL